MTPILCRTCRTKNSQCRPLCRTFTLVPDVPGELPHARACARESAIHTTPPPQIQQIHIPCTSGTRMKSTAQNPAPVPDKPGTTAKTAQKPEKTILCTAENAHHFRQIVKNSPVLTDLVDHLQQTGLFPGLRAMRIAHSSDLPRPDMVLAHLIEKNATAAHPAPPSGPNAKATP